MKKKNKILSLLLACVMLFGLLPVNTFAQEGNVTLNTDTTLGTPITIGKGETLTYDLNGHNLTYSGTEASAFVVRSGGTLNLKNSGSGGVFAPAANSKKSRAIKCEAGSVLSVTDVKFKEFNTESDTNDTYSGGAIYAAGQDSSHGVTITIENAAFESCRSGGDGGAIFVAGNAERFYGGQTSSTVNIKNTAFNACHSSFRSNDQWRGGGAIRFIKVLNANIEGCTFTGEGPDVDSAGDGGAVDLYFCRTVAIKGCRMSNFGVQLNGSYGRGGALHSFGTTNLLIENNTITNNKAVYGGGIQLEIQSGAVTLKDNIISHNIALVRGGGISADNPDGKFNLESGEISNNNAAWGGGVDYTLKTTKSLELKKALISGNTAPRGGGIWLCPTASLESYSTVGGAIFDNTADGTIPEVPNTNNSNEPLCPALQASGSEVRYEGKDTDDKAVLYYLDYGPPGPVTVLSRAFTGALMHWYNDAPNNRYQSGNAEADPTLYTDTWSSFGLHGELEERFKQDAKAQAELKIINNKATQRGGGIASNAPIIIGEEDQDVKVIVKKVWEPAGAKPPKEVLIDLYRVDTESPENRVLLNTGVTLNEENGWTMTFKNLQGNYSYEVAEHTDPAYATAPYETQYSEADRTYTVTITNTLPKPKINAPGIEKKIRKPILDKEGSPVLDKNGNPTYELIDYLEVQPGDTVTFRLKSNVPDYLGAYLNIPEAEEPEMKAAAAKGAMEARGVPPERGKYELTFHDKLDSHMTYADNLTVTVNGKTLPAPTGAETDLYTVTLAPDTGDGCTFHVTMDLVKIYEATDSEGNPYFTLEDIEKAPPIVVTYNATVNKGTIHGAYPNEAWVTYEEDESAHNIVHVHVYAIDVFKYDQKGNAPLAGAEFALYSNESLTVLVATGSSDAEGKLLFEGLKSGVYYLKETKAPDGYIKSNKALKVKVKSTESIEVEEHIIHTKFANSNIPRTGDPGTWMFTAGGLLLIAAAGAFYLLSRRKRMYNV